jgi:hypothetical protein
MQYYQQNKGRYVKSWDENRDQAATAGFHAFSIETFYNGVEVHNDSVNTAAFRFRAATTPSNLQNQWHFLMKF